MHLNVIQFVDQQPLKAIRKLFLFSFIFVFSLLCYSMLWVSIWVHVKTFYFPLQLVLSTRLIISSLRDNKHSAPQQLSDKFPKNFFYFFFIFFFHIFNFLFFCSFCDHEFDFRCLLSAAGVSIIKMKKIKILFCVMICCCLVFNYRKLNKNLFL